MFTSKSKLTLRAVSFPFRESSRSLFTRRKVLGYVLPASQIECWPAARQTFWVAVPLEPKAPLSKDQLKLEWPVVSMVTGVQPAMARAGLLGRTQTKIYALEFTDRSVHVVRGSTSLWEQAAAPSIARLQHGHGAEHPWDCPCVRVRSRTGHLARNGLCVRARCSWVCRRRAMQAGWIAIQVRCLCQIC